MFQEVLKMQKQKRFVIQGIVSLVLFATIYFILDYLNGGYRYFLEEFDLGLVIGNIVLNVVMILLSVFLMNMSSALVDFNNGKEGRSSVVTNIAIIFGMLTYGCTTCVIAFFAMIGIVFSVAVLPLAGLPYKLISFGLLLVGLAWLLYEIKHPKCKIPQNPDSKEE